MALVQRCRRAGHASQAHDVDADRAVADPDRTTATIAVGEDGHVAITTSALRAFDRAELRRQIHEVVLETRLPGAGTERPA